MDVAARVYLKLFGLLCEAITKKCGIDSKKPPSLKQIANARYEVDGKEVYFAEYYFNAPFKYFIDLRTGANKGNTVSVKDYRLVRAIELIEGVGDGKIYSGPEWERMASRMLQAFENAHPEETTLLNIEDVQLEETRLLDIITSKHHLFPSQVFKTLIADFFKYLNDKNYYEAWTLLKPELQSKSAWQGDLNRFRDWFSFVGEITLPETYWTTKYGYMNAFIKIYFVETGRMLTPTKSKNREVIKAMEENYLQLEKLMEKQSKDRQEETVYLEWGMPYKLSVADLTEDDYLNVGLQKVMNMLNWRYDWHSEHKYKYAKGFSAELECVYYQGRWLIGRIACVEVKSAPLSKFHDSTNNPDS